MLEHGSLGLEQEEMKKTRRGHIDTLYNIGPLISVFGIDKLCSYVHWHMKKAKHILVLFSNGQLLSSRTRQACIGKGAASG